MNLGKGIVKARKIILLVAILLCIPSVIGMAKTRINYDMLTYLPKDMDTAKGQDILLDQFGKGAFSFVVIEGMSDEDVKKLESQIKEVEHVDTVLWYDSFSSKDFPKELLPSKIYDAFNTDNATMLAVFFDESTSADGTMQAIREIRSISNEQVFVSGMSAMVTDLKDLCEKEEPVYVAIAVVLALLAMLLFLDSWIIPFIFLASIGMMILLNMGSNIVLGEISYITKALSAVLQLAVTMDYSIFLWNSYNEELPKHDNREDAMAQAINETMRSVVGSSITTVAGFIALCFMSYTLGRDLGIVMAKGVIFGVVGCVTVLPALILLFDKVLQKSRHKALLPGMDKPAKFILSKAKLFVLIFALLIIPAYIANDKTNNELNYDLGSSLPQDLPYGIANAKLKEDFNTLSTHMALIDSDTNVDDIRSMIAEMEKVDGVEYVLGLESFVGNKVPEDVLPQSLIEEIKNENYELLIINSSYRTASDECNDQIDALNAILKKYDEGGMLIGEAPCMKDMITTTGHDFVVVNSVSILLIVIIIALVEKSISLPIILIAVIELSVMINLGIPHLMGQSLSFITPTCISTIQLGATVDYAILMTTRYLNERNSGKDKHEAASIALTTSMPSIIVSGMGLFAATFGVAIYSDIDMISSMCMLMARGAIISMVCVILFLPALLMLLDKIIMKTTWHKANA